MADEFTIEQAVALWGDPLARQLLKNLVEKNAFISEIPEYGTLRCHHMLKVCTEKMFEELPEEERRIYEKRMGSWYHRQKQYPKALYWFSQAEDYEALLGVLEEDRGLCFGCKRCGKCPEMVKKLSSGNPEPASSGNPDFHETAVYVSEDSGNDEDARPVFGMFGT